LNVDKNSVDLFSTFTANIDIINGMDLSTLFTDTWINIEKWLWDLTIKSLPLISENDAYLWVWFIKNKVSNNKLIDNNNWTSWYNIIAWHWTQLEYSWDKANNKILDWNIQPQVFNITNLINEKKNSYSVILWDKLLENPSIDFISSWNPHYIIKPDFSWNVNLTNNTLYYFGDYDVYIWDYNKDLDSITFHANENLLKNNFSWITIFTKWSIEVNQNIILYNNVSDMNVNSVNYVAFMWNKIEINPRVTSIEWTYAAPLTNNAYIEIINDWNYINYSSSWNIWIIRPGYSNIPLIVKWNVIWWNIIRERTINKTIDNENITEKYEFDYKLYLWIPPVMRK